MGLIKMNGVNYWGSAYGQGIIAPMIYSTEEKEVGVWTDGKPLYQITVDQTIGFDDDYTVFESGIENAHLVNAKCEYSSGRWMSANYPSIGNLSLSKFCYVEAWNGALKLHNQTNQSMHWIATIQYTKIADVAGSGIYTPSGALAVHYSTNEQVIGTWIDGKPLYEKTFELTQQLDLTQNTWVKSELDQGTMKGLFYVLFTNDLGACLNNIVGGFIDNKIAFNSPRTISIAPAENTKVTLQYTKTTD